MRVNDVTATMFLEVAKSQMVSPPTCSGLEVLGDLRLAQCAIEDGHQMVFTQPGAVFCQFIRQRQATACIPVGEVSVHSPARPFHAVDVDPGLARCVAGVTTCVRSGVREPWGVLSVGLPLSLVVVVRRRTA